MNNMEQIIKMKTSWSVERERCIISINIVTTISQVGQWD